MTLCEFLSETLRDQVIPGEKRRRRPRPKIHCKDGFSISVQASVWAYCTPRVNDKILYESVELAYPNELDDLILEYAEDPRNPTRTVYGYVPWELVVTLLKKHGGIDHYG